MSVKAAVMVGLSKKAHKVPRRVEEMAFLKDICQPFVVITPVRFSFPSIASYIETAFAIGQAVLWI